MAFFFYLPNLIVAEIFLRTKPMPTHSGFRSLAIVVMNIAALIVGVRTYYFIRLYWVRGLCTDCWEGRANETLGHRPC